MIVFDHFGGARATMGRVRVFPVVMGLMISIAGCGDPANGDRSSAGPYESGVATCEDQDLVSVEGEGCLSPAEIEDWKTSDCTNQTFDECQKLGFPEPHGIDDGPGDTSAGPSPSTAFEAWQQTAGSVPSPEAEVPMGPGTGGWECSYSPTYDYDWHNDIYCTDGVDSDRPYLLAVDSYITQSEIREAGREYEDMLNSR